MRFLLLLLLAAPVAAQPSAGAIVDAWLADWRRAASGVGRVEADEAAVWTVDGPRGLLEVEADGVLIWSEGRPEREVDRLIVDGERVDARRANAAGDRWHRAFGPASREVLRPPSLPGRLLARGEPAGSAPDVYEGQPAWRVTFGRGGQAWFTRSAASPRLLAVRFEGEREGREGRGGRRRGASGQLVREVRYVRVSGLDLPASAETQFTVRQRRRLREYFVTLTASAGYSRHVVR
ncbi:hypothetical protein [Rubrivirga sp. IMCC43871]|uniref:hypothetical protein n=1 Tax=Rubrivirga sp. IMCC43871 TaxID=3391575 RepID=UPI00398FEAA7